MTHMALARGPDQGGDALAHLGGGLVGEGDGEDLAGLHAAGGQQVGDPVGEHPGLARARPGDDEQRAALVQDRLALLRVEPLEQGLGVGAVGVAVVGAAPLGGRLGPGGDPALVDRGRASRRSADGAAVGGLRARRRHEVVEQRAHVGPQPTCRGRQDGYPVAGRGRPRLASWHDPARRPARPLPGRYLAASDEFAVSGEQRDGDGDLAQPAEPGYAGYEFTREGLADPEEFARFVAQRVPGPRRGRPATVGLDRLPLLLGRRRRGRLRRLAGPAPRAHPVPPARGRPHRLQHPTLGPATRPRPRGVAPGPAARPRRSSASTACS